MVLPRIFGVAFGGLEEWENMTAKCVRHYIVM